MSERAVGLTYGALVVVMAVILAALIAASPTDADRVDRLGNSIRCPVCQGESIADSPSAMARDMMALVSERVEQGWTDEQIISELLASYSGAVLLDPPLGGSTLLLWVAPAVVLVAGGGVILWWKRHPGEEGDSVSPSTPRSRRRVLAGGLLLAAAFAGTVTAAGFAVQERQGPASGVADLEGRDLSQVSNETMEGVIAANPGDPRINGMRLALAERYFDAGDFRSAFPHYLAVAQSETSSDSEAVTALIRLGWMAWSANGEVDAALGMFDRALAIDPRSSVARYLKGQVLWCGRGDFEEAAELLGEVIALGELEEESMTVVERDLEAIMNEEPCT